MSGEIEVLKKSCIFKALEDQDLSRIGALLEKRTFHEGETLATKNEHATYFFVLVSGTVMVAMNKGKSLVIKNPGDFIGMEILSSKGIYKSTLTTLSNGELFVIKREAFLDLIQEDSPCAEEIMLAWNHYLSENVPFVQQPDIALNDYQY